MRPLVVTSSRPPARRIGEPNGFPVPCAPVDAPWDAEPDLARFGASSVLWNNLWGTNYVQWFPFRKDGVDVDDEDTVLARFDVFLR